MEMKTLKDLRQGHGLTQEELADMFGVTSRTIQNMEKDSSNIKDNLLKKYLIAFGVSYDEIFLGKEYEKNVFDKKRKQQIVLKLKRNKQGV